MLEGDLGALPPLLEGDINQMPVEVKVVFERVHQSDALVPVELDPSKDGSLFPQ
jgi:hypothetical protein